LRHRFYQDAGPTAICKAGGVAERDAVECADFDEMAIFAPAEEEFIEKS
jgi:hypothetical protein